MPTGKPSSLPVTSVLFACTHNSIRSPMAEAMLKHLHGRRLYVDSVGVRSGERDPFMVEVLALEAFEARLQPVVEDIRHGHQLDRTR
ncbi:MAG: low molecular weight phosphatase family protein, partial [Rhodospirillales bacterium]